MTSDPTTLAALDAVLQLHAPAGSTLVAVSDGAEWQDVKTDSFEDIVGRETICASCLKSWPCVTIQAIRAALDAQ